jgi:hypothetical protein
VSDLRFLSLETARADGGFAPERRSPLDRALAEVDGLGIEDLSLSTGKLEVRGDLSGLEANGFELFEITPHRGLVFCAYGDVGPVRQKLREQFLTIDLTGALAGVRIDRPDGETLVRRVTDLDLDALPAVGALAHVQAYVLRDGEVFRLFFPQEYGHYVAEVILDAAEGLEERP